MNKIGNKCPITGQEIKEVFNERREPAYSILINDVRIVFNFCHGCFSKILDKDVNSEYNAYFRKNKGILIGHLLHSDFKDVIHKTLHFKSDNKKELENPNNVDLFLLTENILAESKYPIHRKEKADNILRSLYQLQTFEGDNLKIKKDITFWGRLFLQNVDELFFYLKEFEKNELINITKSSSGEMEMIQFSFKGLEVMEQSKLDTINLSENDIKRQYDIGLSFAGEQRPYVEEVAKSLNEIGIKTFYDDSEKIDLWGKNLYQHLNDIYKNKCLYCIIFISKEYASKLWTKHELQSAQARAFKENKEYILPARFDNTELPGLDETIGYIDLTKITPKDLANMASKKVKTNLI